MRDMYNINKIHEGLCMLCRLLSLNDDGRFLLFSKSHSDWSLTPACLSRGMIKAPNQTTLRAMASAYASQVMSDELY